MTIRTRLSLWYAAIMFIALIFMGVLLYDQLVIEPRHEARRHHRELGESEAVDPDIFEDVTGIVFWCGVPAALLALAGGWWLMKKSFAPVATLTHTTEKISAQNLGERLPRTGNGDELDRLTEVLNGMLARLADSFNRIREFTLHASHELKTPLTILSGETETALREEPLSPAERERAASQLDELRRLARIVDGLTLLAKADAGQITLAMEPVRLDELVRDNFADAQILAEPQGIQVELAACEEITVRGDRHRLRQLLLNLADNAVKYNQPRGGVIMSLVKSVDIGQFTITNTGQGIPSEILSRVFDRFFRGDPAHSQTVDGCGLGLSIAKWIVSAHNGTIQIEPVPAQLTTVTVRPPLGGTAQSST
ncbi:MAG TPA: ATP-binding protein [Candidatus Paceibacterota bacterium]|nr:ATP-binding protein [Candidatus Paceibacterota bacterium]